MITTGKGRKECINLIDWSFYDCSGCQNCYLLLTWKRIHTYMFFEGVILKLCSNLNFTLYISVMNYLNDEIDTNHSPDGK